MMEERQPVVPAEAPPAFGDRDVSAAAAEAGSAGINDPRALTILTTEHWGLLTARSLVYNESFARAGMFLTFLSASLVVLGLISTATGFSDAFLIVAAIVLGLDLFVGLTTLGRVAAASEEDLRYLQGMNRLRHAYFEIVPGLDRYFITSPYDDFDSVAAMYGPTNVGFVAGLLHGFTTMVGMIGVICSAIAGGVAAALSLLGSHDPMMGGAVGLGAFLIAFAVVTAVIVWRVGGSVRKMRVLFPGPSAEAANAGSFVRGRGTRAG